MDKNFVRLVATLESLQSDQYLSAPQIQRRLEARGFKVSARTLQRDLRDLGAAYGLECKEDSKPFGWRWPRNVGRVSLPGMDLPEAVSFRLLEEYLAGLLPSSVGQHLRPYFVQARKRLQTDRSTGTLKTWPSKVRVLTPGPLLVEPSVKRAVQDAVSEALLLDRQLCITYRSVGSSEPKQYTINPLGLVMEGRTMYLVASYPKYSDPRTLALHRVEKAAVLESVVLPPEGFTLDSYVNQGGFGCGGDEMIALDATWHDSAGIHLIQSRLAADQVVQEVDHETTRIRANVLHTERLVWWLLSFGERVEVHGPPALRREIARGHRDAAAVYLKRPHRSKRSKAGPG